MLKIIAVLVFVALIGGIKIKVYNDKQKARTYKCRANTAQNADG